MFNNNFSDVLTNVNEKNHITSWAFSKLIKKSEKLSKLNKNS